MKVQYLKVAVFLSPSPQGLSSVNLDWYINSLNNDMSTLTGNLFFGNALISCSKHVSQFPRSCFSSVKLYQREEWTKYYTGMKLGMERKSERERETERLCIRMSRWWIWLAPAWYIRRKARMPRRSHFINISLSLSLSTSPWRCHALSPSCLQPADLESEDGFNVTIKESGGSICECLKAKAKPNSQAN